jgi:hypothetical protein
MPYLITLSQNKQTCFIGLTFFDVFNSPTNRCTSLSITTHRPGNPYRREIIITVYLLVLSSYDQLPFILQTFTFFCKTINLNLEVYRTELSPSESVPYPRQGKIIANFCH